MSRHGARLCVRGTPAAACHMEGVAVILSAGSVMLAAAAGLRHSRAPDASLSLVPRL
jgi:hypothetical protein